MTSSRAGDIEAEALRLLRDAGRPKRRARPRVAPALARAQAHTLTTPFGDIAAWRMGEGPATLFVHGWEDSNALWGPAIKAFSARKHPIIVLDLPGHGLSACDDASIDSAAATIVETARALGPIRAVVGHSFGCAAIIQALATGLAVDHVALVATPVPRTRGRRPLHAPHIDPAVLARAEAIRTERARIESDTVERLLPAMTALCLAIHSVDDAVTPPANSQRLAALWPGAALFLAEGLGHRAVARDNAVVQRITDFVAPRPGG